MSTNEESPTEKAKRTLKPLTDLAHLKTAQARQRKAEADAEVAERRVRRLRAASAEVGVDPKPEPKKKRHGLSKYTPEKGKRVLEALASGKSLRAASAEVGVDPATLLRWSLDVPEFSQQYAKVREIGWRLMAEDIQSVIDKAHEAALDPECGTARIAACRLELDTKKWLLAKVLPKVYGDRTQMEIVGRDGSDLLPKHTEEDDKRFAARVAETASIFAEKMAKMKAEPNTDV